MALRDGRRAGTSRRRFLQALGTLTAGGGALLRSDNVRAAVTAAQQSAEDAPLPPMPYRRLGRTGWRASRLVFGAGSELSRGPNDPLLHAAFDAGVNVFDVGASDFYYHAEKNLSRFANEKRDEIFLISKARVPGADDLEPDEEITPSWAKTAARGWSELLDGSLRDLAVERLDAYYLMASNNPSVVGSDELRAAFEAARDAGKVRFFGLSTHRNAQQVLETAVASGAFDLAMIGITPAGWWSWEDKGLLAGTPPLAGLQPVLSRAREAGIGLVGMKAGRYLARPAQRLRKLTGGDDPFAPLYADALRGSSLSEYQRAYAYVLAHGLDVVNAHMESLAQLRDNVVAAAASQRYFG